jgi:uncharacterized protein (DUF488 family)
MTIGHSTRTVAEFIHLLKAHDVRRLVDVRTVPRSRHNPQFNRDALEASLPPEGIAYRYDGALGGLRHPHKDSVNGAWRNDSFRGYADYMQTAEFDLALDGVIDLGSEQRLALMCAEGAPVRCHRSLVADALLARGILSYEISGVGHARPHRMTSFAHVEGGRVTYPAPAG